MVNKEVLGLHVTSLSSDGEQGGFSTIGELISLLRTHCLAVFLRTWYVVSSLLSCLKEDEIDPEEETLPSFDFIANEENDDEEV
ncbi:hypothetical protein F2Q69_00061564 [Brassica cretica]|uniref:Uncharacterized protein n=1 Tax=Brassica cretica TaxID=69181 RepID=A0A8S9RP06_BRACR|nr:hypothetical protein F2Q69_00061564 [Brassica cretica]